MLSVQCVGLIVQCVGFVLSVERSVSVMGSGRKCPEVVSAHCPVFRVDRLKVGWLNELSFL